MAESDFAYDPVTAIDEANSNGETAAIFADIRLTMGLPLVTSIWRALASDIGALRQVWAVAKPIYESGLPESALSRIVAESDLPRPVPLVPVQLSCLGLQQSDLDDISTIVAAYNRSNGLNLVALSALVTPSSNAEAPSAVSPATSLGRTQLRPLLSREAIDADTWSMIRHVNTFGGHGLDAGVATLWRHLAHWPGLLALVYTAFAPLHAQGLIADASGRMVASAAAEASSMARLRPATLQFSPRVFDTIHGYVTSPVQVARMVTMGNALAKWLGQEAAPGQPSFR